MNPTEAFAHLDPTSPNNFADPNADYVVNVRPPREGEWYLAGAKVFRSERDMHTSQLVVVSVN